MNAVVAPLAKAHHHQAVTLYPEQEAAITKLLDFIADPEPEDNFFVFKGPAGTGKTFCMREVIARKALSRSKFAFTAPTNKAAKVLRQITGQASTIFSLLGLRIDKSGELKKLVSSAGQGEPDISDLDVIFIDEGSMVNSNLFNILRERTEFTQIKVVFMGDAAQLPPIGEPLSRIWTECKLGAELTKVRRHDNQILKLVTEIRIVMGSIAPSIKIESDNDGEQGVWKQTKTAFKQGIFEAAERGDFADGSKSKVIAWRNVRVNEYNSLIRHAIWGGQADAVSYFPGERIVAAAPAMKGEETLLATDDEALVESAVDCKHPMEPRYKAIELKCRTELNQVIRLLVLHPDSRQQFETDSQNLAHEAKANGRLWKKFWGHKELFHDIKYAYALTAHRGQGSTYENVWVDYQDVLLNRNRKEAFQCLYVACSRPTTKLIMA